METLCAFQADSEALSTALIYDGSLEGLFTCIFFAYANHIEPQDIQREREHAARLGEQTVTVASDFQQADRVRRGIIRICGIRTFDAVAAAALSGNPDTGTIIYRFVRYALDSEQGTACARCGKRTRCMTPCSKARGGAINDIAHPAVAPVFELERGVANECEKMKQFVRFQHMENGTWYARCNPRDAVVPLIMDWFVRRFNTQDFMIYDENHGLAGICRNRRWQIVRTDGIEPPPTAAEEDAMQNAWRRFYHALSVDERYNPELRRKFMPKRLWRNLTEVNG